MPESDRRKLVEILEQHDVALIEDDVYGDLRFDGERPTPAADYFGKFQRSSLRASAQTVPRLGRGEPGYRNGRPAAEPNRQLEPALMKEQSTKMSLRQSRPLYTEPQPRTP